EEVSCMKSGVSLQQMLTEVKRQSESKEDYLIAPNRLRMESYGKEMFLHLSDDSGTELIEPMTITGIAHRQIGTHLRIPAAYYDRMREERPDLLAYNANTWFKQENSQRMLRTLDGSARAYLSNRYRRIDNIDIAGVTLPILGGLPDIRFESCQITESRMYIKAVNPRLQARYPRRHCAGRGHHQQQRGRTWLRQHPAADLSAGVQQRHGRE
ncbi:MAG: hypothetical protein ACLRNW_13100, partial [Neglectibacter sp.]